MSLSIRRSTLLAGTGLVAAVVLAAMTLRVSPAEAQGIMSVPACQCSAPTPIPSLSTAVVHCVCGGVACVLNQGNGASGLQCVK